MLYPRIPGLQFGVVAGNKGKKMSNLTIGEIVNDYWNGYIQHKKYAHNTKFILEAVIQRLGVFKIHNLKRTNIEQYKQKRLADEKRNGSAGCISPRTVQMELQLLNAAVNFAIDNNLLAYNPITRFIHVRQNRPKKIVLDDGYENGPQWMSIHNATNSNVKPILLTLYETGMRPGECLQMRWNWLTHKGENRYTITIPAEVDKTGYAHDIPVSMRLLEMFKTIGIKNDTSLIFPSPKNHTTPRKGIHEAFDKALRLCGLSGKGITPYALRRTRIMIWGAIDSDAARHASGHVPKDVHSKHYLIIPPKRLFRLVEL